MRKNISKNISKNIFEFLSLLMILIVIIPLYLIVVNSCKNQAEAADMSLRLPSKWNIISNFKDVFLQSNIPKAFFNSLILTVFSVFILIILTSISAFIMQRREDKFSDFLKKLMLTGISIPFSVVTTFIFMHYLKLTGTYVGMILLYIASYYPFTTYLYVGYFNELPRDIDESAVLDGCGGLSLFYRVIFPLLKPITATAIVINFMYVWNDFSLVVYFFNSADKFTLTLTVYNFFGMYSNSWNLVFTDLIIVSLPVILIYSFLQRFIISGLTAGAVKG